MLGSPRTRVRGSGSSPGWRRVHARPCRSRWRCRRTKHGPRRARSTAQGPRRRRRDVAPSPRSPLSRSMASGARSSSIGRPNFAEGRNRRDSRAAPMIPRLGAPELFAQHVRNRVVQSLSRVRPYRLFEDGACAEKPTTRVMPPRTHWRAPRRQIFQSGKRFITMKPARSEVFDQSLRDDPCEEFVGSMDTRPPFGKQPHGKSVCDVSRGYGREFVVGHHCATALIVLALIRFAKLC